MTRTYNDYIVTTIEHQTDDIFVLKLIPKEDNVFEFSPGQYVYITNPTFHDPLEEHPFSIASSPLTKQYLEFCIRQYGQWTKKLGHVAPGDVLKISEPQGSFIWKDSVEDAIFFIGGLGISPVISMLRTVAQKHLKPHITIFYGNRTPDTVMYRDELATLEKTLNNLRIIYIFSHLEKNHPWIGYRGFITKDMIEKEIGITDTLSFFLVGPPQFLEKMHIILRKLSIGKGKIYEEHLSKAENET